MEGTDGADSVTVSAHKWLFQPKKPITNWFLAFAPITITERCRNLKKRSQHEAASAVLTGEADVDNLTQAFQKYGFDGASLARISEQTGLIKASLYWRFPSGKEAMAEAALDSVDRHFSHWILEPADASGPLQARVATIAHRLREFYADGERACLLDTLTFAGSPPAIREHAKRTLEFWISKFQQLAVEGGFNHRAARLAAEDAVAALEGGLVLARATGDTTAFKRAAKSLPRRLSHGGKNTEG